MTVICSYIFNLVNNPEILLLCICCTAMCVHDCITDALTDIRHNTAQVWQHEKKGAKSSKQVHAYIFFLMKPN